MYGEHLIRTRRVCAVLALLEAAGEMEKYHLTHDTYKNAHKEDLAFSDSRCDNYYRFSVSSESDSYILSAVPHGKQEKDVVCGTLTFDQLGKRNASGGGDSKCWL